MRISPLAQWRPLFWPQGPGAGARAGLLLALAAMLTACGQKGDLYLPHPQSAPIPVQQTAQPGAAIPAPDPLDD